MSSNARKTKVEKPKPEKRKPKIIDIIDSDDEEADSNNKRIKKVIYEVGDIVHTQYGWGIIQEKYRKFKNGIKYDIKLEWGKVYFSGNFDVSNINKVVSYTHPADKINIEITERDLVMLHKGNVVNDKIVEYLLVELFKDLKCEDRVVLLPSYFYNNVCNQPQSYARSISKWKNQLNKEFIIIPICEKHHWTAVILYNTTYISQKYISFLKELSKDIPLNCLKSVEEAEKYILENPTKAKAHNILDKNIKDKITTGPYTGIFYINSGSTHITQITNTIRNFLIEVFYQENSEFDCLKSNLKIYRGNNFSGMSFNLPKQQNDYDCGLYIFYYLKCFFDRYLQDDYPVFNFDKPPTQKVDFVKKKQEEITEQIDEIRLNLLNLFKINYNKNKNVI